MSSRMVRSTSPRAKPKGRVLSANASTRNPVDLVLAGGHVIDPANGISKLADVAIVDGRIVAVAPDLKIAGAKRVDVTGLMVTPGIIDVHTHLYPLEPMQDSYVQGMHADAHLLASGVTTAVDAGTVGWRDFATFKEHCIDHSVVRILAFLNIASRGMLHAASEQCPAELDPRLAAAVAGAYPDLVVGIKSAHYWTAKPWDVEHAPWTSVDRAVDAGALCGKPVMVDFWPRPPERPYPDLLLQKLRPGDIHTHVFAQQFPIVAPDGKISAFLFEARERGIRFDLGHGAGSFWFRNAVPAMEQGFPPDTISTDFHMANVNGPVFSMLHTMSKYLAIGMPLRDVIMRSTVAPARLVGRPELGTLSVGCEADVAVFRQVKGRFGYTDCGHARLNGTRNLECALTVRAGKVVYDPAGLTMPPWRDAPPAYWVTPALQT
jgi:dihydroorotase